MSSHSQAKTSRTKDIDDVLPGTSPDDLLSTLHDPTIYLGPTLEKPLRGRPSDELEWLQKTNCTGICNLCEHVLVRRGQEWGCDQPSCRVAHPMMGCVPRRVDWEDDEVKTTTELTNPADGPEETDDELR